jgi:hypothetical protein
VLFLGRLVFWEAMNDTFELYPLPPAALESLRASASSDGCPEGVAIVHGLPEVRISIPC